MEFARVLQVQLKTGPVIVKHLTHALLIRSEMLIHFSVFAFLVLSWMDKIANLSVHALKVALNAMKKTLYVRCVKLALILLHLLNALFAVLVVLNVKITPENVQLVLLVSHLMLPVLSANKIRVLMLALLKIQLIV